MIDIRKLFLLRDDVVFLNHGSFGACPQPVFAEYQRLQRELEAEPVDFLDLQRTLPGRLADARSRLAAFLGAARDEIVFVPNATTGVNIVARSLKLMAGDEVLTCDHEYGAMDRTWRFLCARSGARYVRRRLPFPVADPLEVVEAIWSGVTARTRVLFLSHLTSPTALRMPVEELVRRARERGIISVIDGAHAPGQIDLDLNALGADFYTGNCHKWMLAPKGAAFLFARPEMQELLEPLVVSWGWESDHPGTSRFVDEHEWTGTRDPSTFLAVPAAIDFMANHQWARVGKDCHALLLEIREEVLALTGLPALCPPDPWLVQMATLPLPDTDPTAFGLALRRDHAIEIPVFRFNERTWLRVSVQGYNTRADGEALITALKTLLH